MATTVKWNVRKGEAAYIAEIANRVIPMLEERDGSDYNTETWAALHRDIQMDITAAHANGCPLQLRALLAADDFNFAHDVLGIRRFIDRSTGRIPAEKFWPRFAR